MLVSINVAMEERIPDLGLARQLHGSHSDRIAAANNTWKAVQRIWNYTLGTLLTLCAIIKAGAVPVTQNTAC